MSQSKDIDEGHAARFHQQRLGEALSKKTTSRAVAAPARPNPAAQPDKQKGLPKPKLPTSKPDVDKPFTSAGHLAFDAGYRKRVFEKAPEVEVEETLQDLAAALVTEGQVAHEVEIRSRHPELADVEEAPPAFLTPLEAMRDVYMKAKGRASPKTQTLLSHPDLEDLMSAVQGLPLSDNPKVHADARIAAAIYRVLKEDSGPALLALTDPRLTELWRLFLEGWEIWDVTEERINPFGEKSRPERQAVGIELFLEGEFDDKEGNLRVFMQSLAFIEGEVILTSQLDEIRDELIYDGQQFYRLDTKRPGFMEEKPYYGDEEEEDDGFNEGAPADCR